MTALVFLGDAFIVQGLFCCYSLTPVISGPSLVFYHAHFSQSSSWLEWISLLRVNICWRFLCTIRRYTNLALSQRSVIKASTNSSCGLRCFRYHSVVIRVFPDSTVVKNLLANARDAGSIPGLGRSPGVGKRQPTPVFLPGKPHGQRSRVGYSPWGHNLT